MISPLLWVGFLSTLSRCDFRKECGHSCEELCHDPDLFHSDKCPKPCTRTCYLSHRCPGICGDPCLPCKENVTVTLKVCGHLIEIECHQSFSPICTAQCEKTLKCGHRCQAHCGLPCTNECNELVKVRLTLFILCSSGSKQGCSWWPRCFESLKI